MMMGGQTLLDHGRRVMVVVKGSNCPTSPCMNTVSTSQWTVTAYHDDG